MLARLGETEAASALLAQIAARQGEALEWTELEPRRLVCEGNMMLARDPRGAASRYEAAVQLARATGDQASVGVALANVGVAAMHEGALDAAERPLLDSLAAFREAGDERNEARVLAKLGGVHLARRDSRRACEPLEDALALFRHLGDARGEARARAELARAYLEMGDPEKAKDDAEGAMAIAHEIGDEDTAKDARALLDEARRVLG